MLRIGRGLERRSEAGEELGAQRAVLGRKRSEPFLEQTEEHAIHESDDEDGAIAERRTGESLAVTVAPRDVGRQKGVLPSVRHMARADLGGTELEQEIALFHLALAPGREAGNRA